LPRAGGQRGKVRDGEGTATGYKISPGDDENILELDSGDGCRTLQIY